MNEELLSNEEREKVKETIQRISDGTLASQIKKNMKFSTTGIALGAIAGIAIASFSGGSRLGYGLGGAIVGGFLGRSFATTEEK